MPASLDECGEAAELALFARRQLSFAAAAEAKLPGKFGSFGSGGLRVSMATADHYGFLNTVEGLTEQSAEGLPDVIKGFPNRCRQPSSLHPHRRTSSIGCGPRATNRHPCTPLPSCAPALITARAECTRNGGGYANPSARTRRHFSGKSSTAAMSLRPTAAVLGEAAMATAAPGSPSLRNLARAGFTIVERAVWRLSV